MLALGGIPMLTHVLSAVQTLGLPVTLVTNTPERHAAFGLPMVSDVRATGGPLAGLLTALMPAEAWVMVVACDMPRIRPAVLHHLWQVAAGDKVHGAVIPRFGGQTHPLLGVYHRRCLPAIYEQLDAGQWALHALLARISVRWVEEDELLPLDPHGESFANLNTPDDVRRWQGEA